MTGDLHDRHRALRAQGLLQEFNDAGVLESSDVHVAQRLGRLGGERSPEVLLAAAVVVRAVRGGSVCFDLATAPELAPDLPWPEPASWRAAVGTSPLVTEGALRVEGRDVYLDRYWREEGDVVADLHARDAAEPPSVDESVLAAALDEYFPDPEAADQRQAAELACRRWTSVITGGPGTGKTTTIARLLGVLLSLEGQQPLRVALAAPTGKAAARMTESLREATEVRGFPGAFADRIRAAEASTLHRLLGWRSESSTRFRHDRSNPLPYDLVVVDETSMVSLTLMARLLEAMRPGARLVLVGDADQLASVEAGAVLGDLVRGWRSGPVRTLRRTHRFGKNIAELAEAINAGDDDQVVAILRDGRDAAAPEDGSVAWVQGAELDPVLRDQGVRLWEAGRAGDGPTANEVFESHRLLCAHRDGPAGASWWNRHVEKIVMAALGQDWLEEWYPGRPFIVNANDRGLRLWNGDTGVVCLPPPDQRTDGPQTLGVLGTGGGGVRVLPTTRLADITTAHAMTVHRSQGSQFGAVTVLLPEPDSRILTRELLYTAVTRARSTVRVVGTEEAVRAAVTRRARRATGLERRLTSPTGADGRRG